MDKVVALVGTGATGIQCLAPLAESAKHVYIFQRTPSAIGKRGNRPTDPAFAQQLEPGWQQARWDNFQSIILGRPVDVDLVDDGWTHDYAAVQHPPRREGMTTAEYLRSAEELDYQIMEVHRHRVEELVADPATAEILKPYYRYLCKRPCFHDEYLQAFNNRNVTLIGCPAGIERITEQGPRVEDTNTRSTASSTAPARARAHPPDPTVPATRSSAVAGSPWPRSVATVPPACSGRRSRGFPNMFIMPAPGQQAVVTVNYTQLAVLGAEFIAGAVGLLESRGVEVFDVSTEGEKVDPEDRRLLVDTTAVMSACTPSEINRGPPRAMNPVATATTAAAWATGWPP